MLAFIAVVASLNFALGLGVAIVVSNDPTQVRRILRGLPIPGLNRFLPADEHAIQTKDHGHAVEEHAASSVPAASVRNFGLDIPDRWCEILTAKGLHAHSFSEAVLLTLRLELNAYVSELTTFEADVRRQTQQLARETWSKSQPQLKLRVENWKRTVQEIGAWLSPRQSQLGPEEAVGRRLEDKLQDRIARAEQLLAAIGVCDGEQAKEPEFRALLLELNHDLEGAHSLSDFTLELLSVCLVRQQKAENMPSEWRIDPVTKLHNRLGLEKLHSDWLKADPQRKRLLSCMFVQCDRLGKLNEKFGAAGGERIFTAFAKLVNATVRNDRGDRAVRVSGSTLAVLLADSGAAGARCAAERVRQIVEATTFQWGEEQLTLVANCAVTEFMLDDSLSDVLTRLFAGIKEAKNAGRNRTSIDEGDGPKVFEALPMTITGRVVQVDEPTPANNETAA